ncbi:MAG: AMP-binding protein [Acidimicrobiia bacterium]
MLEGTVGDLLRRAAAAVPDRLALVDGTPEADRRREWTYADLAGGAEQVVRALLGRFEPGERVAVWAPNCPEWVLLQHGASLAGLVLVTVNPAYKGDELEFVLRQSRSSGVFFADEYRGFDMAAAVKQVSGDAPELREAVSLGEWDAFTGSAGAEVALPEVAPGDPVQIQYTSGTTGFPKGALLHHRGVVNASRFVARRAGVEAGCVWVNAMPMFHIGGCGVTGLGTMAQAGTFVLLPGFDAGLVLELIEAYRGTITLAVPTMLLALLEHPDRARRDTSTLRSVLSGAASVPAELVRRTREAFGCGVSILFGQTELHGVVTQTHLDDSPEDQSQTIGRALPHMELRIADPASGATLAPGAQGEICARGYQAMVGYFDLPDETRAAVGDDGWVHTGDLGTMDERGYLNITGRLKDMIIRGGENIYPREIEDVLFSHPGVADIAVVGVPDERWGEQVAAVIRPVEATGAPSTAELAAYCRERLAHYKTPRAWFFVDAFPLTPSGKVQKFVLRRRITDGEVAPA